MKLQALKDQFVAGMPVKRGAIFVMSARAAAKRIREGLAKPAPEQKKLETK